MQGSAGGGQRTGAPRRGRWSQAEIARLREYYGLRDAATIARDLNRPVQSVRKVAAEIFKGNRRTGPWSAAISAQILGRTEEEGRQRITDLDRMQVSGRWTRAEIAEFKRVYGTRTDEDLTRIFGRTHESVSRLAQKLKLAKDKGFLRKLNGAATTKMPRWTEAELARLKELYATHSNLDIAGALERSVKSVVSKAHNLGLKKDPGRLREMGRENVSLRYKAK